MDYSNFITGTEWTIEEKRNGRVELVANEGFWITDNVICDTSSFSNKMITKRPDFFGTVTDEEKIEIEKIQKEINDGGA